MESVRRVCRAQSRHGEMSFSEGEMSIPEDQIALARRPIPAMQPVPVEDWCRVTGAYAAQMAEKARLMAERPGQVLAIAPGAEAAVAEFGATLRDWLRARDDFSEADGRVTRPDGAVVQADGLDGLTLAGRLVQEDICILERQGDEHALTAAILCFPANWSLAQKLGRPLTGIHDPVDEFDEGIARRVQRLFDGLAPGRVLSRANLLRYADPTLHQPGQEWEHRDEVGPEPAWIRSERQTLRKLPGTGAVVFTILTLVAKEAPSQS